MKTKLFFLLLLVLTTTNIANSATTPTLIGELYYNLSGEKATVTCPPNNGQYTFTSIAIPNSVTFSGKTYIVQYIGNSAFANCTNLTSVTIPYSVTAIGSRAFYGCSSLTAVNIPSTVIDIYDYAFAGSGLIAITITANVKKIGSYAFDIPSLKDIYYTGSIEEFCSKPWSMMRNFTSGYNLYIQNSKVSNLSIPSSVTEIANQTFWGCGSLISVEIPNTISIIGNGVFCNCLNLTSVIIPNSVTEIGISAFASCISLKSIVIPSSVTTINLGAFSYCYNLVDITIPNSVTTIKELAFEKVANIKNSSNIAGSPWGARSVNGLVEGDFVFNNSTKTALLACSTFITGDVSIPNSVQNIGRYAFYNCKDISSIIIPKSVENIESAAFGNCSRLTSLFIDSEVKSIGVQAFQNDTSLTSVSCFALTPPLFTDDYGFWGVDCSKIPLYVPEENIGAYINAKTWRLFNPILPLQISEDDLANKEAIESASAIHGESSKILHNGQILILRSDKVYNLTGQEVK